jgi:hypothetical protein
MLFQWDQPSTQQLIMTLSQIYDNPFLDPPMKPTLKHNNLPKLYLSEKLINKTALTACKWGFAMLIYEPILPTNT